MAMAKNIYQVHGFKAMHTQHQCFDRAWTLIKLTFFENNE
jgi:hypothetical protein